MDTQKGHSNERIILVIQDVFIILVLCILVVGFASGKLFPRKSIEEIVSKAILDTWEQLG